MLTKALDESRGVYKQLAAVDAVSWSDVGYGLYLIILKLLLTDLG